MLIIQSSIMLWRERGGEGMLCTHNASEGRWRLCSLMLERDIWLDRRNERCMHSHDLDNQQMESFLKSHIHSRGLGRGINMRHNYPQKTHYIGRHLNTPVVWARLSSQWECYLFQGISHPNIHQYGTSVVGWLCLDHSSG